MLDRTASVNDPKGHFDEHRHARRETPAPMSHDKSLRAAEERNVLAVGFADTTAAGSQSTCHLTIP